MRGLVTFLVAATLTSCAAVPAPRETYLGEFWVGNEGERVDRVARVDHGDGIYEDTSHQIRPKTSPADSDCAWEAIAERGETNYRGLVRFSRWYGGRTYNNCLDWYRVDEIHDTFDFSPWSQKAIYEAVMNGERVEAAVRDTVHVIAYKCAVAAAICDRDHSLEIIDEHTIVEVLTLDTPVWWHLRGDSAMEIEGRKIPVIAIDNLSTSGLWRKWYDPEHQVILTKENLETADQPIRQGIVRPNPRRFSIGPIRYLPADPLTK